MNLAMARLLNFWCSQVKFSILTGNVFFNCKNIVCVYLKVVCAFTEEVQPNIGCSDFEDIFKMQLYTKFGVLTSDGIINGIISLYRDTEMYREG